LHLSPAWRSAARSCSARWAISKTCVPARSWEPCGAVVSPVAKLSDYKGKVVLLDFWATWCGPCKIEIPWFMEFEQTYKDRGFAVVGVSMDEDGWDVVKPYIQARKINYRVLLGNDQVGQLYGGVESLPTTFLIDRSGRIAKVHVGLETGRDGFKNEILNLL